jgi:hypothetical protein
MSNFTGVMGVSLVGVQGLIKTINMSNITRVMGVSLVGVQGLIKIIKNHG